MPRGTWWDQVMQQVQAHVQEFGPERATSQFRLEVLLREPGAPARYDVEDSEVPKEEWTPAFHLPSRIRWHMVNAHMNLDGVMYLNIPFRFYAPGGGSGRRRDPRRKVLSRRTYEIAKTLGSGVPIQAMAHPGTLPPRLSQGTMSAREQAYRSLPQLHEPAYEPAYTYNVRPGVSRAPLIHGLHRVQGAHRLDTSGRVTYMTWRTIRQDSPNWWIPPRRITEVDRAHQVHEDRAVERAVADSTQAWAANALRLWMQAQLGG